MSARSSLSALLLAAGLLGSPAGGAQVSAPASAAFRRAAVMAFGSLFDPRFAPPLPPDRLSLFLDAPEAGAAGLLAAVPAGTPEQPSRPPELLRRLEAGEPVELQTLALKVRLLQAAFAGRLAPEQSALFAQAASAGAQALAAERLEAVEALVEGAVAEWTRPDAGRLKQTVAYLASPSLEGRAPMTTGSTTSRDYIAERMRELGLAPAGEDGGYFEKVRTRLLKRHIGNNVVGVIKGSSKPDEYVYVDAHYDHWGKAGGKVQPGANDNASGVAVMLELARALSIQRPERTVVFLASDFEEGALLPMLGGLKGAYAHVRGALFPRGSVKGGVVLDMLGGRFIEGLHKHLLLFGAESSPQSQALAVEAADGRADVPVKALGVYAIEPLGPLVPRANYDAFRKAKVPFVFATSGVAPEYHTERDTIDTVDFQFMAAAASVVLEVTRKMASADFTPGFAPSPERVLDWTRELLTARYLLDGVLGAGTRVAGKGKAYGLLARLRGKLGEEAGPGRIKRTLRRATGTILRINGALKLREHLFRTHGHGRPAKAAVRAPRWKTAVFLGAAAAVAAPVLYQASPVMFLGFTAVNALVLVLASLLAVAVLRRLLRLAGAFRTPLTRGGRRAVLAASLALGLALGAAPTVFAPRFVELEARYVPQALEAVAELFRDEPAPAAAPEPAKPLSPAAESAAGAALSQAAGRPLLEAAEERTGPMPLKAFSQAGPADADGQLPYLVLDTLRVDQDDVRARGWTMAQVRKDPAKRRQLLDQALAAHGGQAAAANDLSLADRNLRALDGGMRGQVERVLSRTAQGRRLLDALRDRGGTVRLPTFYSARLDQASAMSLPPLDAVLIDEGTLSAAGFGDEIYGDSKAQGRLAEALDVLLFHELYHAAQMRGSLPLSLDEALTLEMEYEAYIADRLYLHEKLKEDPHTPSVFQLDGYERFLEDLDGFLTDLDKSKTYERFIHRPSARFDAFLADVHARWPALRAEGFELLARRFEESDPKLAARYRRMERAEPPPRRPAGPGEPPEAAPTLGERLTAALSGAGVSAEELDAAGGGRYFAVVDKEGVTFVFVSRVTVPVSGAVERFGSLEAYLADRAKQRQLVNEALARAAGSGPAKP